MNEQSNGVFPQLTASNLEGRQFNLPGDFEGEINLLFIAFVREQQDIVDRWVNEAKTLANSHPKLCYYELPTICKVNVVYRKFINGGIRTEIQDLKARESTITLYLDKMDFRSSLEIPDEETIYVMLVDRKGSVLWRTEGKFTEEKLEELNKALSQ
ncbi:MAG: hypothetical protein HZA77_04015 [Candidatus Schekmanbacteria bacterium]|nr:hypothetical protein [Candidatus Schekmanbacteria bacterium]